MRQTGQQVSRWLSKTPLIKWRVVIGLVAVAVAIIVLFGYLFERTLWDWLQLLLVPAAIAVGGMATLLRHRNATTK